jgi:hypothetical protein
MARARKYSPEWIKELEAEVLGVSLAALKDRHQKEFEGYRYNCD